MSLVRVWTDIGSRKPVPLIAKIVEENGVIFTIRYLSECDDKVWRYEEDTYEIDSDSIAEYLKTSNEQDIGFSMYDDGFIKVESDDDYVPSEEEESDEDSLSSELEDEDDEECEEEFEEDEEDDDEEENVDEE